MSDTPSLVPLSRGLQIADYPEEFRGQFVCNYRGDAKQVYEAIDNRKGHEFETRSFDSFEEASQWLLHKRDLAGQMHKYVSGEMTDPEVLKLFSHLVSTGVIRGLQPIHKLTAASLIEQGYLGPEGQILKPLEIG